ncbi:thiol peroxidase [Streptococcus ovuberis]|uniref:Thiol peroxidase n=1 Tax=Streptococcus ovuberis TaxID=1936207 RepID=A0A7X6MWV4_9STRE|nr:thiol peroxidase [Streptococcus ovuberis]NKZ19860.1 thiol peroxidase [Streptococcus ovuberis]
MTTFIGKEVTVEGAPLKVGDIAPDFTLINPALEKVSLSDFSGKKVISIVPSIDTGICSAQTRRFNQDLSDLEGVTVITVSCDLPFAQRRWCGAEGLEGAITLSDYYDHSFGKAYGVFMTEWHLLARAVLVLDDENRIRYAEYLDNVNEHPDYEAALAAVKAL